ncbi:hypothetical protein MRB53_037212 [Persea americana]|nr:hypothetical protein MRB53_037212 [Persea americana]
MNDTLFSLRTEHIRTMAAQLARDWADRKGLLSLLVLMTSERHECTNGGRDLPGTSSRGYARSELMSGRRAQDGERRWRWAGPLSSRQLGPLLRRSGVEGCKLPRCWNCKVNGVEIDVFHRINASQEIRIITLVATEKNLSQVIDRVTARRRRIG